MRTARGKDGRVELLQNAAQPDEGQPALSILRHLSSKSMARTSASLAASTGSSTRAPRSARHSQKDVAGSASTWSTLGSWLSCLAKSRGDNSDWHRSEERRVGKEWRYRGWAGN